MHVDTDTLAHTLTGGQAGTETCIIKWTKIQRQSHRNIQTLTQWQFSSVPALHLVFTHGLSHTHTEEKPPSFCINISSLALCDCSLPQSVSLLLTTLSLSLSLTRLWRSLHLTHPSAHTPITSVMDNSCRSRDSNLQPRVTSPTLYPLESRLPRCSVHRLL